MYPHSPKPIFTMALASVAALSLASCEFRETDAAQDAPLAERTSGELGEEPVDARGDAASATDPEPAETPAASIIREGFADEDAPQTPAEPVELVLPFADGTTLTRRAERLLEEALASAAMAQGWPIRLGGHSDSSGTDQANLRVSQARAEAAAAWLIERGVAAERITIIAFGEQNPLAPNARPDGSANDDGRRSNRRVELRIAPPRSKEAQSTGERSRGEQENAGEAR